MHVACTGGRSIRGVGRRAGRVEVVGVVACVEGGGRG